MPKHPRNHLNRVAGRSVSRMTAFCITLLVFAVAGTARSVIGYVAEAPSISDRTPALADDAFIGFVDHRLETDWYGIYMHGNKIGYAKSVARREELADGTIYRVTLSATMRFQSKDKIDEMEMRVDSEFEGDPPYLLRRCSERTRNKGDISEITMLRGPNGYLAKIGQGKGIRIQGIGSLYYTLKHVFAVQTWVQTGPRVGDSIMYPELDFEKLKAAYSTSRIKAIRNSMISGVKVEYYEVLTTNAEGLERLELYGTDGKPYTISFGDLIRFQLEPEALATKLDKPIDLFVSNLVPIDRPIGESAKVVRLELAIDEASGALIGDAPGQRVVWDEGNARYIVTLHPTGDYRIRATDEEIKSNLEATTSIPVNHPKVRALAQKAVQDARTPMEKVARLVQFVQQYIEDDYTANPLTVLDIIEERKGDCNQHADLFTAMARSQGLPCRKVSGLTYLGDEFKAFGGHAWNEVVIDGVWVPVDPTFGQTKIDATHLRFPVNARAEWQVMTAMPQMRVTILHVAARD